MARVKTAKQRITDFLKAKGLDAAEIKDAFDELDAADVDLDKLADYSTKNDQWVAWYNQVTPAMQEIINERDSYKSKIEKLQAAGLTLEDAKAAAAAAPAAQPASPAFDADQFQTRIVQATNATIKDAAKYGIRYYNRFKEELDYDAVEKLMSEKKVPFEVAYGMFTQPKEDDLRKKEVEEKIKLGIQEGLQAELSKQGIRKTRKRTDDIEAAPLDKPAPSDADLKAAFMKDLDTDVTH